MTMRFCYSVDWNDHTAYPRGLVIRPPAQCSYRPAKIRFDEKYGRPWAFFDAADAETIHASSLIPTNDRPWILDTDHIQYLLLQREHEATYGNIGVTRQRAEELIAHSLSSSSCRGVVAWSRAAKKSIEDLCLKYGLKPPSIRVIYPAVIEPPYTPNQSATLAVLTRKLARDSIKILTIDGQTGVCKIPGRKNVAAAVSCFRCLKRKGYPVELIVVGSTERVKGRIEGLHFVPYLPREELWQLYKKTDILLFLSRQESFGFVLMEAMANGICCVTAIAGSLPAIGELIDSGKTGFLVPFKKEKPYPRLSGSLDMDQLCRTVESLVSSNNLRNKIGRAARRQFEPHGRFSIGHRNRALRKYLQDRLE